MKMDDGGVAAVVLLRGVVTGVPVPVRNCSPAYEMEEFHGCPPAMHGGIDRASVSEALVTDESKMTTVLVRIPETCGQVSVDRITSANIAVLLVPSGIPTIGTPFRIWLAGGRAVRAKIPARESSAGVPNKPTDVAPRQAR
jgi:hypothetical protein